MAAGRPQTESLEARLREMADSVGTLAARDGQGLGIYEDDVYAAISPAILLLMALEVAALEMRCEASETLTHTWTKKVCDFAEENVTLAAKLKACEEALGLWGEYEVAVKAGPWEGCNDFQGTLDFQAAKASKKSREALAAIRTAPQGAEEEELEAQHRACEDSLDDAADCTRDAPHGAETPDR